VNVCTVIAKNYLAFARVLARSFREYHPDGRFTVLVLDEIDGRFDPASEPFDVLFPSDLDLPEFEQMAGAYDVLELSTAVKPWLLRRLLRDSDHAVYLDPDTRLYAPLDGLDRLAVDHGIVLTPHNVAAMPRDGKRPSETDILVAGAYNLGFVAVSDAPDTLEFLDWWAERLRTDCIVDTGRGYFVDQRWIDLVPGIVPSFQLLRDPAYNVAYWNLHSRPLSRNGAGYEIAGAPLRFFHFSGYDPRHRHTLSRHQDRIDLVSTPVLRELCDAYADELLAEGYERAIKWDYSYAEAANGLPLMPSLRRMYADGMRDGELTRSVFEAGGAADLADYAKEPADPELGVDPRVTRYALSVYHSRGDLRHAFPTLTGHDLEGFLRWFAEYGPKELGPVLSELSGVAPGESPPDRRQLDDSVGVNLVGYFSGEFGVGEVGRQVAGALDAANVPVLPIGLPATHHRQGHEFGQRRGMHGPFGFNLMCVNADQTADVAWMAGPEFFDNRYTIGWWWWETSDFPSRWLPAFDHLDELWVGSRFVADTLAPLTTKPVLLMPTPVDLSRGIHPNRAAFDLPADAFVFLVTFDHLSVFDRKNPVGAVEAFRRAFPVARDDVRLVVKSINGRAQPDNHDRLRYAARDRPDIVVMDQYLDAHLKNTLVASCDAYVSLHRSEGFGISLAEALVLHKPVIATDYSGTVDFIRPDTAFPVPCSLRKVGAGNEPYLPDGLWGEPDLDVAAELMRTVFNDRDAARRRADAGAAFIAAHYSPAAAGAAMRKRLAYLQRVHPKLGAPHELAAEEAAEQLRKLGRRGPAASRRRPWSPIRILRRIVLRTGQPIVVYAEELNRGAGDAVATSSAIVRAAATDAQARAEAAALAVGRRLDARVSAVEGDTRALMAAAGARQDIPGHTFAEHADLGRVLVASPSTNGRHGGKPPTRDALQVYVDLLTGHGPVVDLSGERGELLDLLVARGVAATGVTGDPLQWLDAAQPRSLGAVFAAGRAQRLDEQLLPALLAAARSALTAGGVLVLESANPYAPHAGNGHSLFPETMLALVTAAGFADALVFAPGGRGDYEADRLDEGVYAVVAHGTG
jgi:glycosyltransferase involved in cell wall biosynthesis